MRLPSVVNLSDNQLYSEVVITPGELAVLLNSRPNCMARACQFGIITVGQDEDTYHFKARN